MFQSLNRAHARAAIYPDAMTQYNSNNFIQEAEDYITTIRNNTNPLTKHEQIRDLVAFAHHIMAGQNTESVSGVGKSNAVLNSILSTSEKLQNLANLALQGTDAAKSAETQKHSSDTAGLPMCAEGALPRPALQHSVSHGAEQTQRNRNNNSGNGHGNEEIADISWDVIQETHVKFCDIVGCEDAIERIKESVVLPVRFPRLFGRLKAKRSHGIMLYGPPGTGKSMIARATASDVNASFFNASCADLTSRWVGGSEKKLQSLFRTALHNVPAIIFFDEIDSIACRREDGGSIADQRLTNQLLVELDEIYLNQSEIFVIAATNLPWQIDLAVMRRFPHMVYIALPDMDNRKRMFRAAFDHDTCSDPQIHELALLSDHMSGSDIANVINNVQFDPVRTLCNCTHFLLKTTTQPSPATEHQTAPIKNIKALTPHEARDLEQTSPENTIPASEKTSLQLLCASLQEIVSLHGEECIDIPHIDFSSIKQNLVNASPSVSREYLQQYKHFQDKT